MQKEFKDNINVISLLRFPLIIGVVFIHSIELPSGNYPIYDFFFNIFKNCLCGVCVPLFFFFSGYLFFANVETLSLKIIKDKYGRRIKSLLIPYVFWNLFYIAIIAFGQLFAPSLFSGAFKSVVDFSLRDWLCLFYCALGTDKPVAYQLWFLRDLMCVTLIAPLIYWLCKRLSFWWLLFPFALNVIGVPSVSGFSFSAISFFSAGSYFGINKQSFIFSSLQNKMLAIVLYLLLVIIDVGYSLPYLKRLEIIVGCVAVLQIASMECKRKGDNSLPFWDALSRSSFFIYCYHGIFATFLGKIATEFIHDDFYAVSCYFLVVFVIVVFGLFAYTILNKLFTGFTALVTGGRN